MKLFKIKTYDETDYVASNSFLEGLKYFLKETSCSLDDIETIDEIPESDWGKLTIKFDEYAHGKQITIPANQLMETITSPEIISSTTY